MKNTLYAARLQQLKKSAKKRIPLITCIFYQLIMWPSSRFCRPAPKTGGGTPQRLPYGFSRYQSQLDPRPNLRAGSNCGHLDTIIEPFTKCSRSGGYPVQINRAWRWQQCSNVCLRGEKVVQSREEDNGMHLRSSGAGCRPARQSAIHAVSGNYELIAFNWFVNLY